ncbi:hypothetical protein EXU48_06830 [Occultella glacieicola]|uniref:Uncharacterized protein n=1 Tax=Occultella glacieicola TaxID=2518684 RepID=A0ABY2E5U2_9MICO|nr:hypothetical protein [Occultella glacieicola]TDE95958.1 hypothetical protein EXU48_06830 [Occultella glacieicola]
MKHLFASATRTLAAATLGLGLLALVPTAASAAGAPAPEGGCPTEDEGVTVVVDFTGLGGEVEIGCAEGDPASGREALELAGFAPVNSSSGLLCTIDSQPDPCPGPDEFDGNFWSYWSAEPGAEWVSYQVGADGSDPAVGSFEGWRYFDGTAGPTVTAADVAAAAGGDGPAQESTETSAEEQATGDASESTDPDAAAEDADSGVPVGLIAGLAAVAAVIVVATLVARRRRAAREE